MKKIIFVRHAKSSWEYDVNDIDRPLKKRGINDSGLVSREFAKVNLRPEAVFSSPANRAFETCKIFVRNLNISNEIVEIHDQIYDFGGRSVIEFIQSIDNSYKNVMIFGHNHALTSIVNNYGDRYIENLSTSGLAVLEFDIDKWSDLRKGRTSLILLPRDLR